MPLGETDQVIAQALSIAPAQAMLLAKNSPL
jgi:hypothetical protein